MSDRVEMEKVRALKDLTRSVDNLTREIKKSRMSGVTNVHQTITGPIPTPAQNDNSTIDGPNGPIDPR